MNDVEKLVDALAERLHQSHTTLACAESCTGGWIAKVLTDRAGSSQWFDRGYVTYSNSAKQQMLGVSLQTLQRYGAVSRETAIEMVGGALRCSGADYAVAVTGIAGPGGGSEQKPVGTVWIACASDRVVAAECHLFNGDREAIRLASVTAALQLLLKHT